MKEEQLRFDFNAVDTFIQIKLNEEQSKADYKFRFKQSRGLITTLPSRTVQGEEISLADLMIKSANGLRPAIQLNGYYDENPDHDDPDFQQLNRVDPVVKDEVKEFNSQKTKLLNERMAEIEAEREKRRKEKEEGQKS